ncbi:imidazole glycerol phosphate synthase subunit HisH [Gammaproteobacteria bacterium]|nr:imidazole glycerol phosphate synthase subunit HisH [Gammaproteobacteria bacterium]
MKTVIVDYGSGNANSLKNAFEKLGHSSIYSSDIKDIQSADRIILPGIGHHGATMKALYESNLVDALNYQAIEESKPILGICLGMQLMTSFSEEGGVKGFGWIKTDTKKINPFDKMRFKVPHVGWNLAEPSQDSNLMDGIPTDNEPFYFCNSYAVDTVPNIINHSFYTYDKKYIAHFEYKNLYGVQFHPEKSHAWGMKLLENFLKL